MTISLTIEHDNNTHKLQVNSGTNLRRVLLDGGFTPYTKLTAQLNCGGRRLCATCGVDIVENAPAPTHWQDKAARRFRYPRLSCQVTE